MASGPFVSKSLRPDALIDVINEPAIDAALSGRPFRREFGGPPVVFALMEERNGCPEPLGDPGQASAR